jgi:hypothetical protein
MSGLLAVAIMHNTTIAKATPMHIAQSLFNKGAIKLVERHINTEAQKQPADDLQWTPLENLLIVMNTITNAIVCNSI